MIRALALLAASTFTLAACGAQVGTNSSQLGSSGLRPGMAGFSVVAPGSPTGPIVDNFAISFLNSLQNRSFIERREFCGYIWMDGFGRLQATPPIGGTRTGCEMPEPQIGTGILASYHTHGAYSPALSGEIPSSVDLRGDFNYGMNGYVSTPGGRVWLVDNRTKSTRQLCGRGCVTTDPRFNAATEGTVQFSYTLNALR